MKAPDVERLFIKNGADPNADHLRQIDKRIDAARPLGGENVRHRSFPWGTHTHYQATGKAQLSAPVFRPSVQIKKDIAIVRWSGPEALIAGLSPKIGETSIFAKDEQTKVRPALIVQPSDFQGSDECGIYFEVTTTPAFNPLSVKPVALPSPPREPFKAYKLALFIRMRNGHLSYSEAEDRELFSAQKFVAINARPGGIFEAIFWPTF